MLDIDKELQQDDENIGRSTSTLIRGLEVLKCFKSEDQFLGNRQIAERTGLPKATVSRLSHTLTEMGYLRCHGKKGGYSLGPVLINIGYSLLAHMHVRCIARPLMQALAEHIQGAVKLGICDGQSIIYVDVYRSTSNFALQLEIGYSFPIGSTATGKAHLAALPEIERTRLMEVIRQDDEESWLIIKAGIEDSIKEYRNKGYCLSLGDWRKEVNAIAVPLNLGVDVSEIIVFSCCGPAFQLHKRILENEIGPRLLNLVGNVQTALRYR